MSKVQKHLGDLTIIYEKMTLKFLHKPNKMYRKRKENILKIQQMRKTKNGFYMFYSDVLKKFQ